MKTLKTSPPPSPPRSCKKIQGTGEWKEVPCPGDGKNLLAKRGTDFFLVRGVLNHALRDRRANGNHILITRASSNLPMFLGGIQVNPFYLTNVPPILASKFFPPPGQQDKLLPSRFEFLHSLPPPRGKVGKNCLLVVTPVKTGVQSRHRRD